MLFFIGSLPPRASPVGRSGVALTRQGLGEATFFVFGIRVIRDESFHFVSIREHDQVTVVGVRGPYNRRETLIEYPASKGCVFNHRLISILEGMRECSKSPRPLASL